VSLYHEYKTTGNRTDFEEKTWERRSALTALVIGELITGDAKYMSPIADGLWATLEESTWVFPAHVGMQHIGTDLPDPDEAVVDLFDGEAAASVSTIQWLLSSELDRYSPVLAKRVRFELTKRVIAPYLARDDFWWMGFAGRVPNNWNPWINSNVLATELLTGLSADTINLVLDKVLRSTDTFINGYGDDGGCDEGPSYWSEAGGKLIRILDLATSVTGGRLDFKNIPLLRSIGAYIYKTHIAGQYFVNFADATARTIPDPSSVYTFGRYFNDDTLRHFAAYVFGLKNGALPDVNLHDFILAVETYRPLEAITPQVSAPLLEWMPQVQVLTVRSDASENKGLFLAVQGGNNGESHNHNDVGNFIVYAEGIPVIVDAGAGTYTARTFSSQRYTLWNMQSQWHNCPVINGVQQMDGSRYKAAGVDFSSQPDRQVLRMDIASAYPKDASVKTWERTFEFRPSERTLRLDEAFTLDARKDTTRLNFLTPCVVTQRVPGELVFAGATGKPLLVMVYDKELLTVATVQKDMDDNRLRDSWGKSLTRVSLVFKDQGLAGKTEVRMSLP
jgi:hypothetical protein